MRHMSDRMDDQIDARIRETLQRSAPQIPEDVSARFDDALSEAVEQEKIHKWKRKWWQKPAVASLITACLLVFVLLPNMNANISYAMQELPVIGGLIRVVTVYKQETSSEHHFQEVTKPQLEVSEESSQELKDASKLVNANVDAWINQAMAEFQKEVDAYPEAYSGMMTDYEVVTNTDQWFTLRLMVYYSAASSNTEYHYYHIDKQTGEMVTLSDLFVSDYDYVEKFSKEVKKQMHDRMKKDENITYMIAGEDDFGGGFSAIDPEQNFYWDEEGNLVLVFDKYAVAPGYMGCPEFTIARDLFEKHMN